MNILALAWEFPPRIVGGIARHVAELYPEIIKLGYEVHLITIEFGSTPKYEVVDGIHLYRCTVAHGNDFLHWIANMNESMGCLGGELLKNGNFDLIHAHDWLVGDAAIALKHTFKLPMIATIHATEYGRYNGIHNARQEYINGKEKLLTHEAWRIIVCSQYMHEEIQRVFQIPADKIDVIYNGIYPEKKHHGHNFDRIKFRRRFANDREKIIYYVGRMTYEKGISVLLEAAQKVIETLGEGRVKLVIIGGGNTNRLKHLAKSLGIWEQCYFTGFMSDADLDKFQTIADCAVFPSLYEPFGIVALESFAARVPVVVSNTGGLPEVVQHEYTGVVTLANDPNSLTWGILKVLQNPKYSEYLVSNAYKSLAEKFSWDKLAKQTVSVYDRVVRERSQVTW